MANLVKFTTEQETIYNANNSSVENSSLVRINNTAATNNHVITQRDSANAIISTFTLMFAGGDESFVYLIKTPTDTIESDDDSGDIVAVGCAFY